MQDRIVTIYKDHTIWRNIQGFYYALILKGDHYERIASDSLSGLKRSIKDHS